MFGTILISICTFMHTYVFWRAWSIPWIEQFVSKKVFVGMAVVLWGILFLARVVGHDGTGVWSSVLEFAGMTWMAALFLTFVCLLFADLITLFGWLAPAIAPSLRAAALVTGAVLSGIALFQGMRPPVIVPYEVNISDMPAELDGTVLVAMSDTHLGSLIGPRWLKARVEQINAIQPDVVLLLGDIFEGHGEQAARLTNIFGSLSPPLGVWGVLGNHEFYGGRGSEYYKASGFHLLRNEWRELKPGLILAGVDDLTVARRRGRGEDFIVRALAGKPEGGVILLSHTPWQSETASKSGADLMLSGHTHSGQIWPFGYLVGRTYPLLAGRYEIGNMTAIVCRGTGTWGPRMRLWRPGEILRITLRADRQRPR